MNLFLRGENLTAGEFAFEIRAESWVQCREAPHDHPGNLGAYAAPPRFARGGIFIDGDQPRLGAGASLLDEIPHRHRHRQTSRRAAAAAGYSGSVRNDYPGDYFILADAVTVEGSATLDCRAAAKSSSTYLAPSGCIL